MAAPACGQRRAEPSPAEAASTPLIIPVVSQLESMEGGRSWENIQLKCTDFLIRELLIVMAPLLQVENTIPMQHFKFHQSFKKSVCVGYVKYVVLISIKETAIIIIDDLKFVTPWSLYILSMLSRYYKDHFMCASSTPLSWSMDCLANVSYSCWWSVQCQCGVVCCVLSVISTLAFVIIMYKF